MADKKQIKVGTITLLHRLFKASNLEKFIKEDLKSVNVPHFHDYITSLCAERGEVAEHIINRAGIERTFGHQLFNGTRRPSREKVIQLAIGFGMDTENTQKLLRMARKNALYPKLGRDAAIIYCLEHHMTFMETQDTLHIHGITLLGEARQDELG